MGVSDSGSGSERECEGVEVGVIVRVSDSGSE